MKIFQSALLVSLLGGTDAIRRGRKRNPANVRQLPRLNYNAQYGSVSDMMQGDDPFASGYYDDMRGPRPNYSEDYGKNSAECENIEAPYCPEPEECFAEMKKEDCTCDCTEEPPPKCDLDVMIMVDVCSCSPEVWHGIKSYVDALVTKYDQEIGISKDEVNIAVVGFANSVETIVAFGEPASIDPVLLSAGEDSVINRIDISPFTSQGTYIDKALEHVANEFRKARPDSSKVLITLTDGYNHPTVRMENFERNVNNLINMDIQIHGVARNPYTTEAECQNFNSESRKEVCTKRAKVLKSLNGGDDQIYIYSEAQSTHDIIESSEEMCPEPTKKALHCECECDLPKGCPGERGGRGKEGEQGGAGREGEAGEDGPAGPAGADGPKGPKGEKGPDGSPGIDGPPGEPGIDARHGQHGLRGNDGPIGDKGIKGPPGPSGETGENGDDGPQGPQGAKGKTGMPGAPGKQGKPKMVNMGALRDAVFAILDELKPGGTPLPAAELEKILDSTR